MDCRDLPGGLLARQAEASGWLRLVGFVPAFIGVAVVSGLVATVYFAVPLVAVEAPALVEQIMTPPAFVLPLVGLGFGLGLVLFGLATMRARVLPRWAGLLLIIGAVLQMVEESPMDQAVMHAILTTGRVLVGLGLIWLGYAVVVDRHEAPAGSRAVASV